MSDDVSDNAWAPRETLVYRPAHGIPRWLFAALGFAALLVAWAMTNPLGAAPDEQAHAIRAAGTTVGHLEGTPVQPYHRTPGLSPAQADQLNQQAASYTFPARLTPTPLCLAEPSGPAAICPAGPSGDGNVTMVSYAAGPPPTAYVVAGTAMRLPAILPPELLGRLALALCCALFLAGAAWAAAGRSGLWPMTGLALAVTPTALFLGSELAPTGVAVCAGICFAAGVLGWWLGPPRRGLIPLIVVSGAALAAVKPAGIATIAAVTVVSVPLIAFGRLFRAPALLGLLLVIAAALGGAAWDLSRQAPPPLGTLAVTDAASTVVQQIPALAGQAIAAFGPSQDVSVPAPITLVWEALVALLAGAALLIASWRDRLAIGLAVAAAILAGAAQLAFLLDPVGWALQGRFVLAIAAIVPLLSGFLLQDAGLRPRADAFVVGLAIGALQFAAFWFNARHWAVGEGGPLDFVSAPNWTPAGGWMLWLILAGAGSFLVALSLLPLTASERDEVEGMGPRIVVNSDLVSVGR